MKRRFGSIRQRGQRFIVMYTGPDGGRHTPGKSFATEQQAELWLAQEETLVEHHRLGYTTWMPPKDRNKKNQEKQITVGEYLTAYNQRLADHGVIRASTFQQYTRVTENRITRADMVQGRAGQLRDVPMVEVTSQHIQDWWDAVVALFPDTAEYNRKAFKRLKAGFNDALERGIITATPVTLKAPARSAAPKYDKPLLEDAELFKVLGAVPARYRALTVLTLFHGLRVGEAIGLHTHNVVVAGDVPRAPYVVVQVRDQLQRLSVDGKVQLVRQPTKTQAGVRDVYVFPEFTQMMQEHLSLYADKAEGGLFTVTTGGKPVMDTSFRSVLIRAADKAGVPRRVHPHSGRRWITTRLAEMGATPAEIGSVLGDTDLSTITHIYTSVRQSRPQELMGMIGSTLDNGQGL
ncbi:site-specific recombinase, phage integrase family [Corynebacterium efficiens YS-314]|nr:tyrosine-type recombinase/integrase [Corynebacterium efficiens]EEW49128.1 site-specific recombinase, phage integrase family [Corynebacterium efficiens YS-314]